MGALESILAPLSRLLRPLDGRLNPIVVKEVRQSLRGRYFSVVFWIMLTLATFIGCLMLVQQETNPSEHAGVFFFVAMYGCLSAAVHVFVPFAAFLSIGSEWEENTFDLLVLTDLRPRSIVGGKLLSAGVQILLYYSAFGPYLVFAFLLRGLDLVAAFWVLGLTLVSSLTLSCVALCLSSLARQRFLRVFLMAVLATVLVWACAGSIAFSVGTFEEGFIHTPEFRMVAGIVSTAALVLAAFAFAFACTRFAHSEENRSTGLRVLTSITLLAGIGWMTYIYHSMRFREILPIVSTFLVSGSLFMSVLFCSEDERLGRRVRLQVPRSGLIAFLVSPYLPGGGRGVLLYLGHAALVLGSMGLLQRWIPPAPATNPEPVWWIPIGIATYGAVYLFTVTGLLSFRSRDLKWRVMVRCAVPLVAVLAFVVPTLAGLFLELETLMRAQHIGNPVWVLAEAIEDRRETWAFVVLGIAGGAFLLNLPRIVKGYRELAECRRGERASAAPESAPPGVSDAVTGS